MRRVVLATLGSYGDLNPFLGIAVELQRRGHEPIVASNALWKRHVESLGFEFRSIRPGWDEFVTTAQIAQYLASNGLFTNFRGAYDDLMAASDGADALVTLNLVIAGPLVGQKMKVPWLSVVLEPLSFLSTRDSIPVPQNVSLPLLKTVTQPWAEPVERLRSELNLPPGRNPFCEEYLTADAVLALFSPLLASPQPDWPPQTVITGFVDYDYFPSSSSALNKLDAFLAVGAPPIVFTLSSDAVIAPVNNFQVESLRAAKLLGYRAILVGADLPQMDTPEVLTLSHVSFSEVFPRAAAVVHHGGIGTSAIALKAGKPMLVVPGNEDVLGSYAQPDTAERLRRLGVARVVRREQYSAAVVARELWTLLFDPRYAASSAFVAQRLSLENGARAACDAIDDLITKATKPSAKRQTRSKAETSFNNRLNPTPAARDSYLHLLKRTLTRMPFGPLERSMLLNITEVPQDLTRQIVEWSRAGNGLGNGVATLQYLRSFGLDLPSNAETMIGLFRLDNLEHCITTAVKQGVPGDLAETGVWRGGASIFMRAVLKILGDTDRKVWLADSFEGLPKPDAANYPADRDLHLWALPQLAVSLSTVKANFARYGLLDEQVGFIEGWFRDTLPTAPIDKLAVLRLDGDLYESTIVALRSLYHKVSRGGFVIIDDYGAVPAARQAVDEFRATEKIVAPLCPVDWTGVYWQVI